MDERNLPLGWADLSKGSESNFNKISSFAAVHVHKMGFPTNKPDYPVINQEPGIKETIAGFRTRDWATIVGSTVLSLPFGYYAGMLFSSAAQEDLQPITWVLLTFCL